MASTKITTGSSFGSAIEYDEKNGKNKKDQKKIAKLPATPDEILAPGFESGRRSRLIGGNLAGSTSSEFAKQFEEIAKQRPDIKKPVHKASMSLKPGERLETHQLIEVSESYLKAMGYGNAPFLIYEHREKPHQHIHLITSKVDFNGEVVSSSFEKVRARKWANEMEEKYDLTRTPLKAREKGLSMVELAQAERKGKPPPKLLLQEIIKQALQMSKNASEFIKLLEDQNISIKARTNEKQEIIGISYGLDGQGFRASNLGTLFTWKGLQKEGLNYKYGRDYKRLEEASERASEKKSGHTKRKSDRVVVYGTQSDVGREDRGVGREKNQTDQERIIGFEEGVGHDQKGIESVSRTATTDKREIERQYGKSEESNTREFQRFGGFAGRETETLRQFGSEEIALQAETEAIASEEFTEQEYKTERIEKPTSEYETEANIPTDLTESTESIRSDGFGLLIPETQSPDITSRFRDNTDSGTVISDGSSGDYRGDNYGNTQRNLDSDPNNLCVSNNKSENDIENNSFDVFGTINLSDVSRSYDGVGRTADQYKFSSLEDLSSNFRESMNRAEETTEKVHVILEEEAEKKMLLAKEIEQKEAEELELEEQEELENERGWDMEM